MSWELATIVIISALIVMHFKFNKMYSAHIQQCDDDVIEMSESRITGEVYVKDAILDRARMSAQADVDRTNNIYHIVADFACLTVLVYMFVMNLAGLVVAMEWMSAVVLPLPVLFFMYHLRNTLVLPIGRKWSLLRRILQ